MRKCILLYKLEKSNLLIDKKNQIYLLENNETLGKQYVQVFFNICSPSVNSLLMATTFVFSLDRFIFGDLCGYGSKRYIM